MRVWLEDFKYHSAMALRAVGVAIAVLASTSALVSEAQQSSDVRTYAAVAAAGLGLLVVHLLTRLPPSATVVDLLRPFERDIVAVAREEATGDDEDDELRTIARIVAQAVIRIRHGGTLPADRRAWLRTLLHSTEPDEA